MKRKILTFAMVTMMLCAVPCVGVSAGEEDGYVPTDGIVTGSTVKGFSGDANNDEKVDILDLILIKKHATGYGDQANSNFSQITWRGDMFRNGKIDDVWDMHLIRRTLLERTSLNDYRSGIVLDPDGDALSTSYDLTECLEIMDIWREGSVITVEIENTSTAFEPAEDATLKMEKTYYPDANNKEIFTKDVGVMVQGESVTLEWKVPLNSSVATTVNILRATKPIWTVPTM